MDYHHNVRLALYNSQIVVRRKFSWGKSQDEGSECALQMLQVDYHETCPLKMLHMDYHHNVRLALYNFLIFVRRKVSWGKSQDEGQKCALQMLQVDYHCRQEYVYL
jgi:hypothetical protein